MTNTMSHRLVAGCAANQAELLILERLVNGSTMAWHACSHGPKRQDFYSKYQIVLQGGLFRLVKLQLISSVIQFIVPIIHLEGLSR